MQRIMLNKISDYLIESELNSDDKTCQSYICKICKRMKGIGRKIEKCLMISPKNVEY